MQARLRSGNLEDVDVYDATGVPFATAAGRISYLFDLQGPSLAIDSACSSAIVGMHLAADSLRNKESNLAIVGAANLDFNS
jgi:acyl transferase domain-containing protein